MPYTDKYSTIVSDLKLSWQLNAYITSSLGYGKFSALDFDAQGVSVCWSTQRDILNDRNHFMFLPL